MVDPEGHPGQHHDEDAGQVRLEHEVANVALQLEVDGEPSVDARGQLLRPVGGLVPHDGELGQVCPLNAHHGVLLPVHDHVVYSVPVCREKDEEEEEE